MTSMFQRLVTRLTNSHDRILWEELGFSMFINSLVLGLSVIDFDGEQEVLHRSLLVYLVTLLFKCVCCVAVELDSGSSVCAWFRKRVVYVLALVVTCSLMSFLIVKLAVREKIQKGIMMNFMYLCIMFAHVKQQADPIASGVPGIQAGGGEHDVTWEQIVIRVYQHDETERETQCLICWQDAEPGEAIALCNCSHAYHEECLRDWMSRSPQGCPLRCRRAQRNRLALSTFELAV